MPATIVDVARRAGVSTATVSRILSGASASRPATVAAVRAAAEALDYRPSSIARSLKTRTTNTLGLIVTDVHNPFFPELVRAVEDAAWEHGLRIILCNGARDPRREADYLAFLQDGRVDGLIVAAGHLADGYAAQLARTAVPVVIVNSERADLGVPTIVSDNRAGGRLAAEHLLEHGHTRFAIVTGPTEGADAASRLQGALEALEQAGVARDEVPVVVGVGVATGGQSISGLLAERPATTALICHNDVTAIEVIRTLRATGRRVPEEISVVGFDDIDAAAWVEPPLTTVAQQKGEMGHWAVRRLVERIARPAEGGARAERVILPVALRVRGSTGPAPSSRGPDAVPAGSPSFASIPASPGLARYRGRLLRRAAAPATDGAIVAVDPVGAGWSHVEVVAFRLRAGQAIDRPAAEQERLVLVLEGRAAVTAGAHDFGVVGSRATVFDGPPPPVILVGPGVPVNVVAATDALVVVAAAPAGPIRRTAHIPPDEILVEARGAGPNRPADPPPPAARGGGRPADRLRGLHSGRQLVQLSASQARHGGPSAGGASRGGLLLPVREARRVRLPARVHPRPARWTRCWPPRIATSSWSRRATTPSAPRPATTAITSTSWPGPTAPGTSPWTRITPGS